MNAVFALSGVVIKELYRRKDFYVLFFLTALLTVLLGLINFFNDSQIVGYVKAGCMLLIWVSALVIAIATAARQIPQERESRTIFPLLAKPVTRGQVIVGKFMGCWLACGIALVVFYLFFGVVTASREHTLPVLSYLQALWMHWMMLSIVVAAAILGSVVFAAPSSNTTICFIVMAGILVVGGHLNRVAVQQAEPVRTLLFLLYYFIPHLEWFNLKDFLIYGHALAPWGACALATIYAAVYAGMLLFAAWLVFRRKMLSV